MGIIGNKRFFNLSYDDKGDCVIIFLLATVLAIMLTIFVCMVGYSSNNGPSNFSYNQAITVYDKSKPVMPTYYQFDERWKDISYLNGTIETSGCGLVAASMALSYFSDSEVTPDVLASYVGDSCSEYGVNDMQKFSDYISSVVDGVIYSEQLWKLSDVIENDVTNCVVFAGLQGQFGNKEYDGHVVLMHGRSDDGMYIRDPASVLNTRFWSFEELEDIDFIYFYIVCK